MLFDLRNAFSHTKGALIPKFDSKAKNKSFTIHIPVKYLNNRFIEFDKESPDSYALNCKIIANKVIKVRMKFIYQIFLLSHHVLEILKKCRVNTLLKYIERINNNSQSSAVFP